MIFIKLSQRFRRKARLPLNDAVYSFFENLNNNNYLFIDYGLRINSNILFCVLNTIYFLSVWTTLYNVVIWKRPNSKNLDEIVLQKQGMLIINLTVANSGYCGNGIKSQRVVGVDPIKAYNSYTRYLYENCDVHILRFCIFRLMKKHWSSTGHWFRRKGINKNIVENESQHKYT